VTLQSSSVSQFPFAEVSAVTASEAGTFDAVINPEWTIAGKPNGGYLLAMLGRAAASVSAHDHVIAASAYYLRTQVAFIEVAHVGTELLYDADELVADRTGLERRVAAVVPEVRSADACQDDAHEGVGGLSDRRIRAVSGSDVAGFVEDGSAHVPDLLSWLSVRSRRRAWRASGEAGRPCEGGTDRAPLRCVDRGMLVSVDVANDIAEFLSSRRARVTPEQAGLPTWGPRRVKGLRREEVASLAGVSVEYYKRLERGNANGVSDSVLEALAHALQLDDAERAHLFDLARAASPAAPRRRRTTQQRLRPSVLRIVESLGAPAIVRNSRVDYLAANPLGRALYAPLFDSREQPANSARFAFLDPLAQEFYVDWERSARDLVAHLRSEAGRNPYDRGLSDLVGELSTRSEEFRTWWAAHNVRYHQTGTKRLHHPVVGELELVYEVMNVSADDGMTISVYTAEPGSRSAQALDLLASWAATPHELPDHR
jgi:transcriptional regulator with XRE-family HTH domain